MLMLVKSSDYLHNVSRHRPDNILKLFYQRRIFHSIDNLNKEVGIAFREMKLEIIIYTLGPYQIGAPSDLMTKSTQVHTFFRCIFSC